MGGGLMQLIAIGAQDVFLTGNPQITFFKIVYRRYTNFSKECILQDFSGSGDLVNCVLARNGDLVQEIYLKLTYSITDKSQTITDHTTTGKIKVANISDFKKEDEVYFDNDIEENSSVKYNKHDSVLIKDINSSNEIELKKTDETTLFTTNLTYPTGTKIFKLNKSFNDTDLSNLINFIEVEIGGQKIDKHYSQWLDIYNELFEKNHDYRIALNKGIIVDSNRTGTSDNIYIPLRFWFNRNVGLALPLISLQYNEVKIILSMKTTISDIIINNKVLLVNYIYLDTDERRRFGKVNHEYLIEQVQFTGQETLSITDSHIDLTFNHPIKSLFWTTEGKGFIKTANLQLNGHDRFQKLDADYFHLIQPYECFLGHSYKMYLNESHLNNRKWISKPDRCSAATPVGMYSFCLKPNDHQPSGSCNFSRIDNCRLNYLGGGQTDILYLFGLNYNVLRIMNGMGGLVYSN
jgi:hypothetical protein